MKRFVALLAVICLLFTGALSYGKIKSTEAYAASELVAEEAAPVRVIDYEALYALHEPDEVVATVDGKDVTWGTFFYFYKSFADEIDSYITQMNEYYGAEIQWTDVCDPDSGATYEDIVAESGLQEYSQYVTINNYAASVGSRLSSEQEQQLADERMQMAQMIAGEDATEEDFYAFYAGQYMPAELIDLLMSVNYIYPQAFDDLYGENGSKVSDEDAIAYLEAGEYVSANHILFMTMDPSTGESVDEDTANEKKAQAGEIAAELQAIEDSAERLAKFKEYKGQYDEDTGKIAYPDGYVFTPGMMVPEFETAADSLGDYEVSDPVQTVYGYHVIIRLPLDPDALVKYSESGIPLSARSMYANEKYGEELQNYYNQMQMEFVSGFEAPKVTEYITEE